MCAGGKMPPGMSLPGADPKYDDPSYWRERQTKQDAFMKQNFPNSQARQERLREAIRSQTGGVATPADLMEKRAAEKEKDKGEEQ